MRLSRTSKKPKKSDVDLLGTTSPFTGSRDPGGRFHAVLMPVADGMNGVGSLCSRTFPNMERRTPSCSAAHLSGIVRKRCYPGSALVGILELHQDL
jgi:hypothetical protein